MHADTVLRRELVDKLTADGALTDPHWIEAFIYVPRHVFVPEFWYRDQDGLHHVTDTHPDWLPITYRNMSLITQFNDRGVATCASSQPSSMARMLEALDVADGHRVLEVGTGTGYNAALLAHRLGADQVTTVEYDPVLAATAAKHLDTCGYQRITTTAGDGNLGHPAGAPYDRIIATYGLRRIPPAWIRQTNPGGLIVVSIGYGLAALRVDTTTESASGRFLPTGAAFMWSRSDATALMPDQVVEATRGAGQQTETSDGADYDDDSFVCWLRLFAPHLDRTVRTTADGVEYLFADDAGNWVRIADGTATCQGTAWADLDGAHRTWCEAGRPGWDRLGLTVTADGNHTVWADDGTNRRCWMLG